MSNDKLAQIAPDLGRRLDEAIETIGLAAACSIGEDRRTYTWLAELMKEAGRALAAHEAEKQAPTLDNLMHRLGNFPTPEVSGEVAEKQAGPVAAKNWYELRPPMLELGRTYKTISGKKVRMVSISNAGTEYETMADEDGHHRYSRSHGRIIGRCTGSKNDDPLNIQFAPPSPLSEQDKEDAELPPMPKAKHFYYSPDDTRSVRKPLDLFTTEQLIAYGRECNAHARAARAKKEKP